MHLSALPERVNLYASFRLKRGQAAPQLVTPAGKPEKASSGLHIEDTKMQYAGAKIIAASI
jgi:hypothetical protein